MTREEAKELLPIIQAFAEGKKIEYSTNGKNWSETEKPLWDNYFIYRVKPEPKFNPKTLQPFDKVLVRDTSDGEWLALLFSHINNKRKIIAAGCVWVQVIPYNKETKHLVGTTKEAPKHYRYWEGRTCK